MGRCSSSNSTNPNRSLTPAGQFLQMFEDEIFHRIAEQSNIYTHQKDGFILATFKLEINELFGILMQMNIVKMPSKRYVWQCYLYFHE